jgi:microcompartment protein CcmL/EutN
VKVARHEAIGFVETFGLAAAIACADAGVKGANVELLGYEYTKGGGMCTVKFAGNVGACKAAVAAGKRAAEAVNGTLNGTKSTLLKARPADGIKDLLIYNAENVGGEIALAKGVRPKATNRPPVLVKNWKPKEEPKTEAAPEPPVVEDLKEEPVVEPVVTEVVEEAPAEAPVEETPAEAPAEEAPAEAPVEEAPAEAPAEEAPAETPAVEPAPAEKPPKKTSTGKKKSKKKKNPEK